MHEFRPIAWNTQSTLNKEVFYGTVITGNSVKFRFINLPEQTQFVFAIKPRIRLSNNQSYIVSDASAAYLIGGGVLPQDQIATGVGEDALDIIVPLLAGDQVFKAGADYYFELRIKDGFRGARGYFNLDQSIILNQENLLVNVINLSDFTRSGVDITSSNKVLDEVSLNETDSTLAQDDKVSTNIMIKSYVNSEIVSLNLGDLATLDTVDTLQIDDGAVTEIKLANDAVTTTKIADANITEVKLANDAVTTAKINDSAVITPKINDNAVTTPKINDNAVTTPKINDNAVTTDKVADLNITEAKLANDAVTTPKINDNAITTVKIDNNAVTTTKIADANITEAKLANDAVTTTKIADANITEAKLANDAVTTVKVANAAISNSKLANMSADTIKGVQSPGVPQDLTPAQVRSITSTESTTELNNRDTNNRNRANHTGTQATSTIVGLDAALANTVNLTGDQTIAGIKTFTSPAVGPTPVNNNEYVNKGYIDSQLRIFTGLEPETIAFLQRVGALSYILSSNKITYLDAEIRRIKSATATFPALYYDAFVSSNSSLPTSTNVYNIGSAGATGDAVMVNGNVGNMLLGDGYYKFTASLSQSIASTYSFNTTINTSFIFDYRGQSSTGTNTAWSADGSNIGGPIFNFVPGASHAYRAGRYLLDGNIIQITGHYNRPGRKFAGGTINGTTDLTTVIDDRNISGSGTPAAPYASGQHVVLGRRVFASNPVDLFNDELKKFMIFEGVLLNFTQLNTIFNP